MQSSEHNQLLLELSEEVQCSVCLDLFKDPHTLPACMHSFCKSCLLAIYEKSRDKTILLCPICRTKTKLDRKKIEGLPRNHSLASIVDKLKSEAAKPVKPPSAPASLFPQMENYPPPPPPPPSSYNPQNNFSFPTYNPAYPQYHYQQPYPGTQYNYNYNSNYNDPNSLYPPLSSAYTDYNVAPVNYPPASNQIPPQFIPHVPQLDNPPPQNSPATTTDNSSPLVALEERFSRLTIPNTTDPSPTTPQTVEPTLTPEELADKTAKRLQELDLKQVGSNTLFFRGAIPLDKLKNAKGTMKPPDDEFLILLIDNTKFGGARMGVVFGLRGIYFNNFLFSKSTGEHAVKYSEIDIDSLTVVGQEVCVAPGRYVDVRFAYLTPVIFIMLLRTTIIYLRSQRYWDVVMSK